jgi:hypothetical protein
MWNNLTHGEWELDHRATIELHEVGQGSLGLFATIPDDVRRRRQIASSYRATRRRSKTTAGARLWQFLGATLCQVRFWYAQRHRRDEIVTNPC